MWLKWQALLVVTLIAVAATFVEGKPQQASTGAAKSAGSEDDDDGGGGGAASYPASSLDYSELQDDEEYDEYPEADEADERAIENDPNFTIQGSTFTFDKGTTIKLPCYIDTFHKNYVIMWKKVASDGGETYLVIGENKMAKDERMDVQLNYVGDEKGSTLIIGLAADQDQGQYVCQLGSNEKKEIKHTVNVRAPPEISKSPKNGLIRAQKGDTVSMRCVASGDPVPEVTWTRVGKRLPDGSKSLQGEELVFRKVSHAHSGSYICTARNGFNEDIRETIEVEVEFAPEVQVEELFIHATAGNAIELVCHVKAQPNAIVKWFKNTMELTDETAKLRKHGHRHTLMIPSVSEADIGNYTCRAENRIGIDEKVLEVSGKAGFADFRSNAKGDEPNSYLLEWQSESRTQITAFSLRHREHGLRSWQVLEVKPIAIASNFLFAGKHSFSGLKTATRYEATVAALNEEGWSRHSKVFHFSTFGADDSTLETVDDKNHNEPLRDVSSASSLQLRSHQQSLLSTIISIAIFTLTWHRL